ncbi:piggyBac transposable element-derived protein 4-like [Hydra vulgaris]|uniref:PiggyBac transposable element-derived protein 4-like n=1 Tax=Hydra vulgaris TaxID=6087 RepID=A0ABM4C8T1_HYDVU
MVFNKKVYSLQEQFEDCTNVEDIEININNFDEDRAIVDVDNENIKEMEVETPLDYHILNKNQVSNLWTCPNFLNSQPGFNVEISDCRTITYYQLFVTDDLLHHLVVQTNVFAQQFFETCRNIPKHSYVRFWNLTNVSEMKKFLALILIMGLVHKPATHFYWSTDKIFQTPVFNTVMSRNRFNLLFKFFHINDNQNLPNPNGPNQD